MELHKRIEYGFHGYQVPPTPRAARSARRRGINTRKDNNGQFCAFDLLATLAGKILLEGEKLPSLPDMGGCHREEEPEIVKDSFGEEEKEKQGQDDQNLTEVCNTSQNNCDRSFIVSELVLQAPKLNGEGKKDFPQTQNDITSSGPLSAITTSTSDCSEKVGCAEREHAVNTECKFESGTFSGSADIELFGCRVSPACKFEGESKREIKVEPNDLKLAISAMDDVKSDNSEHRTGWERKPSYLISSDNSVEALPRDQILPSNSLPCNGENVNLVNRDDDEKFSSGCTKPSSTINKSLRPSSRISDRRIRKLLASKYWKLTPNSREEEHFKADAGRKNVYYNGSNAFKRQRSQRDFPFKKRKLYHHCSSLSNSDGDFRTDGIYNSRGKVSNRDTPASMLPRVSGASNLEASEPEFLQSKDSQVKLKIKSFRVPEFFIEIPETATVGSLKKTVMEAVTAILGGGLHVGVLLQGKKIRDDSKTLFQTGICHENKLDALGFSLEPNLSQASSSLPSEDHHPFLIPCDGSKLLSRYPAVPSLTDTMEVQGISDAFPDPRPGDFNNLIESDHDSAPSPPEMSTEKNAVDTRALVPIPAMNVEALSAVPMRKSKRSDSAAAQRRIRRPFSVSEVEALVQAVEKLGTGRWRDVKLRAFDNAKHRTYVDLKDKWKTLVHTARISPQQRRGEPVPQELLDRVLTAHAYWSQQQVKPQFKQQSEVCRLL
ncbi:OLC1v1007646C1 [Oldenlandia corymbosa var. corymbosa]|uniref:OLC1v1007646C1 n=1 Tax=Oldenlandia corymbosa var. corymbosa TaxID=529605 RepID=A0AAV1DMH7_OLDCO|nr:OLC1v1007646C1 [Oldenlandia corymbosa var. corymbosa]